MEFSIRRITPTVQRQVDNSSQTKRVQLLWAIWHHYTYQQRTEDAVEFKDVIIRAADGICKLWNRNHFVMSTYDLWEERSTFPDLEDNHTYSLAACAKGLKCADAMIEIKTRSKTKKWMRNTRNGF